MRLTTLLGSAAVLLLTQAVPAARAGLIGNGTNTVSALFFLGTNVPSPPYTNPPPTEVEGSGPMLIPAHFPIGVEDEATIDVGDTTITITNGASLPFCSASTVPCPDAFTGFAFAFSSGVDILGVSVDPASAADFQPSGSGLELLTPTDIIVNLVGEDPNVGDQLILDLSFPTTTAAAPEPASLALLGVGLAGLGWMRRRREAA